MREFAASTHYRPQGPYLLIICDCTCTTYRIEWYKKRVYKHCTVSYEQEKNICIKCENRVTETLVQNMMALKVVCKPYKLSLTRYDVVVSVTRTVAFSEPSSICLRSVARACSPVRDFWRSKYTCVCGKGHAVTHSLKPWHYMCDPHTEYVQTPLIYTW